MTTTEKPPDPVWTVPAEFAARWGVATTELAGDDGRVAGLVFTDTERRVQQSQPTIVLPPRQLEVLRGMADGKSNAQIERELYVTADTVKTHAVALFKRLGASDRAHAVALGFRKGVIV